MEDIEGIEGTSGPGVNPNLNKLLQKAREEITTQETIPDGYIEVKLSTRGQIGAPELFYIRNFSPEDIMNLGQTSQENIPIKMVKVLDSLIWNPHNDASLQIKNFHEKEVIELLLLLYETFYTTIFPNQKWVLTEEDWDFIAEQKGGRDTPEFQAYERAVKTEAYKPVFDIDISQLDYHEIPEEGLKKQAKIERVIQGKKFTAAFSLPRFGDHLTLKYFIDKIFKEEDNKFSRLGDTIKHKRDLEAAIARGENVARNNIPIIPKKEWDEYVDYETRKSIFAITASKALYLTEFMGENVTSWPLEQKLDMARDPRLDYTVFKMIEEHFRTLQFGLKEEITVHDPIINKVVTRKYTFQFVDLLFAIRDTRAPETSVSFV